MKDVTLSSAADKIYYKVREGREPISWLDSIPIPELLVNRDI